MLLKIRGHGYGQRHLLEDWEMLGKRRNHAAAFKAKVAVEAIKGEQTLNEIGRIRCA